MYTEHAHSNTRVSRISLDVNFLGEWPLRRDVIQRSPSQQRDWDQDGARGGTPPSSLDGALLSGSRVGVGLAISVPIALAASRLVESFLFRMKRNDPLARIASRIDAMMALRHE